MVGFLTFALSRSGIVDHLEYMDVADQVEHTLYFSSATLSVSRRKTTRVLNAYVGTSSSWHV